VNCLVVRPEFTGMELEEETNSKSVSL